jgi:2-polyprenyl-6-methoxyphenol hydroxylase-like FAD-dependent oxidoreductase
MVHVVIVGAGVAGLSLAIMLAKQNIKSQVLESRQHFDGPTSGVRISAEGAKILRLMKITSIGEDTKRVDMRLGGLSASFSALNATPLRSWSQDWLSTNN